jgi:fumarate hydratase class II
MGEVRKEMDSLGDVNVPADKLWGAQTQRSLEHFSIGKDLIPREMITAYATLKKAAANANHAGNRFDNRIHKLIVPPAITTEMAKGFTLYMMKAVFNGRGDDLVDLARSNLWA